MDDWCGCSQSGSACILQILLFSRRHYWFPDKTTVRRNGQGIGEYCLAAWYFLLCFRIHTLCGRGLSRQGTSARIHVFCLVSCILSHPNCRSDQALSRLHSTTQA